MHRLRQIIFWACIILLGAVAALWLRSQWRADALHFDHSRFRVKGVWSGRGHFCIEFWGLPDRDGNWPPQVSHLYESEVLTGGHSFMLWWEHGDRVGLI